jgi:N-methylhydantoinase A
MEDLIAAWLAEPWVPTEEAPEQRRPVIFDDAAKPLEARILWRPALPAGTEILGPAVIEEPNSTSLIPPGDRAVINPSGHIIVTLAGRSA